jgi:arabinofuranan 3-O-arabinosyltransferase
VTEPASDAFWVQTVVAGSVPAAGGSAAPKAAGIVRWTATARTLRVSAPVSSYLVVNENYNAGWHATIDGKQLHPVRLDGWKQAWLLPAGTAGLVHLTYQPQQIYRIAVLGGLGVLVLLALLAAWPAPREPKGRGAAWTEEPVAGDEGRRRLKAARRRAGIGAVVVALVVTGLWLGGYPGAVIVPAATALFLYCASDEVPARVAVAAAELSRARTLAVLLIAAAICEAEGETLIQDGHTGLLVTVLNATPQVICLAVIGRLAAALILS